jgi:phosphoribosylformylglycinamidine synthase
LGAAIAALPPRWDELLFAEGGARIVVSVASDAVLAWELYLENHLKDHWQRLGQVGSPQTPLRLTVAGQRLIDLDVATIHRHWAEAITRRLEV